MFWRWFDKKSDRGSRLCGSNPHLSTREAKERYYNHATFRHIAVKPVIYHCRRRKMKIAYDEFPDRVEIVTIHPIESRQISERVLTGRWTRE